LITAPPDYRTALEQSAMRDESAAGRIFMRGRDAASLLHRLSTNDIVGLKPGQGARTVLTTSIGRIIDVLYVYRLEDGMLITTSLNQGPPVYGLLKKNIFFNDQVTLEPAGRSHGQLALYGPEAAAVLEQLAGAGLPDLPLHHHAEIALAGVPVRVARREPIGGPSFTLFVPAESMEAMQTALREAGAQSLSDETFDTLRVEQGYGVWGREWSKEYIPLETGLLDAICFSKGCYVGQEIIARMESRNRLAKQLRGLRLTMDDGRWTMDKQSSTQKLEVGGKEAGDLTSAVVSPRFGPIALAYVRTAHAAPGSMVGIAGTDAHGEVVELPFAGKGTEELGNE
jgi:aminomethyltransferase